MKEALDTTCGNYRITDVALVSKASTEATMTPKELSEGQTKPSIKAIFTNKTTIYIFIKFFLVAMIFIFGTMSAYAIIAAATKEPITLIGLGLMGLVAASTYIKN